MQLSAVIFLPDFFFTQFTLSWHTFEDNIFYSILNTFIIFWYHIFILHAYTFVVVLYFFKFCFHEIFLLYIIISFGFLLHIFCVYKWSSLLFYIYFFFFFLYSTIIFEIFFVFCEIATHIMTKHWILLSLSLSKMLLARLSNKSYNEIFFSCLELEWFFL